MTYNLKKNYHTFVLILFSIIFLFGYSWFSYQTTKDVVYFASPDATANYFWAKRFANGESLYYFEPLNLTVDDAVVPRSARSDEGLVKPVSFLGIVLIYGFLGKIFGVWIIPLLTSFFACLGVLFFYGIIKKVFDEKIAFWSALMMFVLAPYLYYASRGMLHNVLFIDLALAGAWLFACGRDALWQVSTRNVAMLLSGVMFGLAVTTRTSELAWLVPAGIIIFIFYAKKIKATKIILFFCGLFLAVLPMLYYNEILYGDFLNFGYTQAKEEYLNINNNAVEENNSLAAVTGNMSAITKKIILPFGFNLKNAAGNFISYYVKIFWYLFWPAFFGGLWILYDWQNTAKNKKIYFVVFVVVSLILGIFYGSWHIQDSIAKNSITIGNSYARYWLPMYLMSLPLAVLFFQQATSLLSRWQKVLFKPLIAIIFIAGFFLLNFNTAVFGKNEGLYYTARGINANKILTPKVLTRLEGNAVVITKYLDKFIWPRRKVMAIDIFSEQAHAAASRLVELGSPVYYYGFILEPKHLDLLNNDRLKKFNLQIVEIEVYNEQKLGLYKLVDLRL